MEHRALMYGVDTCNLMTVEEVMEGQEALASAVEMADQVGLVSLEPTLRSQTLEQFQEG